MLWTAPTTGIAKHRNPVAADEWRESVRGYKQASSRPKSTSAFTPTPDILKSIPDFRS
jgi:hypothetical protein